ncbi:MAG: hypothetical protein MJK14_03615, partial [Rivularia sp. ALOHA_DT_140]|nr:hypothetical protein [Rivularia sp. ALOHA_DT_140]
GCNVIPTNAMSSLTKAEFAGCRVFLEFSWDFSWNFPDRHPFIPSFHFQFLFLEFLFFTG